MSFAIIETGGKTIQSFLQVNTRGRKTRCKKKGETVKFEKVLLLNDNQNIEIGNPSIEGASVEAKLLDNVKDRTILVFHKRRRKHSRKKKKGIQKNSDNKNFSKNGKVIDEANIINEKKTVKTEKKKR